MMNRMLDIPCVPIFSVLRPENEIKHHCFSDFFQTKMVLNKVILDVHRHCHHHQL